MELILPPGPHGAITGLAYFWGWFVTGFDPRHHCQKCLLGWRASCVRNGMRCDGRPIPLDERSEFDYFYLCAGAENYVYSKNFHLAVRRREGWDTKARIYTGQEVIITNSQYIEIPAVAEGFDGKGPKFTTCRNYRFGVHAYMVDATGAIKEPNLDGSYGFRPEVEVTGGRRR